MMSVIVEELLRAATIQLLQEAHIGYRVLSTRTAGAAIALTTGNESFYAPRKFRSGGLLKCTRGACK